MKINKTNETIHLEIACQKPGEKTSSYVDSNLNAQPGVYQLSYFSYQPNSGQVYCHQYNEHDFGQHYRFIVYPQAYGWLPFYGGYYGLISFFFFLSSNRYHK